MRVERWVIITIVAIGIIALTEAAILVSLHSELKDAKRKIERLSDNWAGFMYDRPQVSEVKQNGSTLDRLRTLELQLKLTNQRLDVLASDEPNNLDLEEIVDRKLGEKLIAAVFAMQGRRRPKTSLNAIGEELGLSEGQQQLFKEALERTKNSMLELTALANAEDRQTVRELNGLLQQQIPLREKFRKVRELLSARTPPGQSETYFESLIRLRDQALEDLGQALTEEQLIKLRAMHLNPFAIQIVPAS